MLVGLTPQYLAGPEAIDVARWTGLQLRSGLHKAWEPSDISPHAIPEGARATDHVYLDLSRLEWWDRLRVFWCRLGAHHYLAQQPWKGKPWK